MWGVTSLSYPRSVLCLLCMISSQALMRGLGITSGTCVSSDFESVSCASLIWLCVGYWYESRKRGLFWTRTSLEWFCCNYSNWSCDSIWRNSNVSCESCTQFWMWVRVVLSIMTVLSTEETSKVFNNSTKPLIRAMINYGWRLTQINKDLFYKETQQLNLKVSSWRVPTSTENAPKYNAIQLDLKRYKILVASYKTQMNLQQFFGYKIELIFENVDVYVVWSHDCCFNSDDDECLLNWFLKMNTLYVEWCLQYRCAWMLDTLQVL